MDLSKIFLKDACPTKMGGQAVMEGLMMKGEKKTALAVRIPDKRIKILTSPTKTYGKWMKVPIVRGVIAFVESLVVGCKTLMDSAEILEEYDDEVYEKSRFELWVEKKFGANGLWNFLLYSSVIIALAFTIGVFIILPTGAVNLMKHFTDSIFWLNFVEGLLRVALFILYVWGISFVPDIKRTFMYHGAEHKTIHALENLPHEPAGPAGSDEADVQNLRPDLSKLTVEECRQYPTLHPRCGTSFLMFVFIIAFALHFLFGWPTLWLRIVVRLLLLPLIAGLSYELLKWAGRSDNIVVKVLSLPGLYLQKITTSEPDDDMLVVAIAAVKAVMDDKECGDYMLDEEGNEVLEEEIKEDEDEDKSTD